MPKLRRRLIEKPWGRTVLPPPFPDIEEQRIGEIWFEPPAGKQLPLLAKYIFTDEKLSVQVHPDDAAAHARGLPHGKDECWYILDAEPDAALGLGTRETLAPEALREAALSGAIEDLLDWKPVRPGEAWYVPAGTVHAIGGGLSLLELQRNVDVTYRLYDYGRPRPLHLDEGVAVARPAPYPSQFRTAPTEPEAVLMDAPHFTLARTTRPETLADAMRWILPLRGEARSGDDAAGPGECLLAPAQAGLEFTPGTLALVGAPK